MTEFVLAAPEETLKLKHYSQAELDTCYLHQIQQQRLSVHSSLTNYEL